VGDTRTLDLKRGDLDLQFVLTIDDLLPRP